MWNQFGVILHVPGTKHPHLCVRSELTNFSVCMDTQMDHCPQLDRSYWKACDLWLKEETRLLKPCPWDFPINSCTLGWWGPDFHPGSRSAQDRAQADLSGSTVADRALQTQLYLFTNTRALFSNNELLFAGSCVLTSLGMNTQQVGPDAQGPPGHIWNSDCLLCR